MLTQLANGGAGLRPSAMPALDFSPAADAESLLAALPGSELLRRADAFFDGYPSKSLLTGGVSRSLLYLLTRQTRPRVVLEIGTFFAGTTEVLARALLANGHGELITVDPYGGERVPPILASWPDELRNRVVSLECNSMQCFMEAERRNILFDLAFIDGDHSYEYARYDLGMVARQASPGAIVVMDNCEQPGVFQAAKRFVAENPAWRELGVVLAAHSEETPFDGLRPSFPDSGFLILQAPHDICICGAPRSFESEPLVQSGLQGVEIELDPAHPGGALHLMTFFRSFNHDLAVGRPEQKQSIEVVPLAPGQNEARVAFAAPFITGHDPACSFRKFEFILAWAPREPGAPLRLRRPPAAIVLN